MDSRRATVRTRLNYVVQLVCGDVTVEYHLRLAIKFICVRNVRTVVAVHNKCRLPVGHLDAVRRHLTRLRAGVCASVVDGALPGLRGPCDKPDRRYHSDCLGDSAVMCRGWARVADHWR